MAGREEAAFQGFVEVRCACGRGHTLLRDAVIEGLTISRWKCGTCKRRFVVACAPGVEGAPETFFAIYLDDVPSHGETQLEGMSTDSLPGTGAPAELHFECRCGCRLVGRSPMYGRSLRCPKCAARIVLNVEVNPEDGRPVAKVSYPPP